MEMQKHFKDILVRQPAMIHEGVLDYVGDIETDYCANFGEQWNRFRKIQIDSISGSRESHERFFGETGIDPEWLKGKLVLDAGCGAGRFAEVAAECGAYVIAVDLSSSVYACAQTLMRFPSSQYVVVRADLRDLPFKKGSFDAIFSLGVLHHTPDPLRTMSGLVCFLAPTGKFATWIYEKRRPNIDRIFPRTWVRRLVRGWSLKCKFLLSIVLTAMFFPLGWLLSWFGRTGKRLSFFLPYATRHHYGRGSLVRQWQYSVMDTFDWYGPKFELPQTQSDVVKTLSDAELIGIKRLTTSVMAIIAVAPNPDVG